MKYSPIIGAAETTEVTVATQHAEVRVKVETDAPEVLVRVELIEREFIQ